MKKRSVIAVSLLLVSGMLTACGKQLAAGAADVQETIEEIVVDYGTYGAEANKRIDTLLNDLSASDPSAGKKYSKIMEIWRSPELGKPLNYDVLPDGLPDTDDEEYIKNTTRQIAVLSLARRLFMVVAMPGMLTPEAFAAMKRGLTALYGNGMGEICF